MSTTLGLDYAPYVNASVLGGMEHAGKRMGLPLEQIEMLGQCEDTALAFVKAFQAGDAFTFLHQVNWQSLEARRIHRNDPQELVISVF